MNVGLSLSPIDVKLTLASEVVVGDHLQKSVADLVVVIGRSPSCLWQCILERPVLFETLLIDSVSFLVDVCFAV
jgi:hypothetical protein